MALTVGSTAPAFTLTDTEGKEYTLESLKGKKVYLTFFRYSACIVCRLRVSQAKKKAAALKEKGVVIVPVFESTLKEMKQYVGKDATPDFPIMLDPESKVYNAYGVGKSMMGSAFGCGPCYMMFVSCKFWPAFAKYANCAVSQHMSFTRQPRMAADFLIDEEGKLVETYYGKVMGEHMDWEKIESWAGGGVKSETMER